MKHLPILFLFLSVSIHSTFAINCFNADPIEAVIEFYQDGEKKEIIDNEVILEKKAFLIKVTYTAGKESTLLFNLRLDGKNYKAALKNKMLDVTPASGFAEYQHNLGESLYISNQSYNAWYVDSKENHRYNKITQEGDQWICERSTKVFNIMENGGVEVKVEDLAQDKLYGVFFQNMDVWSDVVKPRIILPVKITFK